MTVFSVLLALTHLSVLGAAFSFKAFKAKAAVSLASLADDTIPPTSLPRGQWDADPPESNTLLCGDPVSVEDLFDSRVPVRTCGSSAKPCLVAMPGVSDDTNGCGKCYRIVISRGDVTSPACAGGNMCPGYSAEIIGKVVAPSFTIWETTKFQISFLGWKTLCPYNCNAGPGQSQNNDCVRLPQHCQYGTVEDNDYILGSSIFSSNEAKYTRWQEVSCDDGSAIDADLYPPATTTTTLPTEATDEVVPPVVSKAAESPTTTTTTSAARGPLYGKMVLVALFTTSTAMLML